jgi:protein-tyrosine phosphatase
VERPGNAILEASSSSTTKVTLNDVQPWLDFVVAQGITHVIALLDENELSVYEDPPGLLGIYQTAHLKGHVESMSQPDAAVKILAILQQANDAGEKVVCHCTGGVGRAGRVAAAWLVRQYHLSPEDATAETMAQAKESGVKRKGDVESLKKWLGDL